MAGKAEKIRIGKINKRIGIGILSALVLVGLGMYASSAGGAVSHANITIKETASIGQSAAYNIYQITDNDCRISFSVMDPKNGSSPSPSIDRIWLGALTKKTQSCSERFFGDAVEEQGISIYRKISDRDRSVTFWVFTQNSKVPASETFLYR